MDERRNTTPVGAPDGAPADETTNDTHPEAPGAAPRAPDGAAPDAAAPEAPAPTAPDAAAPEAPAPDAAAPEAPAPEPQAGAGVPAPPPEAWAGTDVPPEPAAPAPAAEDPATLRRERDEYLALAQRKQAEFENFRKRMSRENAAATDRGVARLATELLGALDHLELALRAAQADGGTLYDGVRMVQQELHGALARVGIQVYDPKGSAFDPTEHEAMAQMPVDGVESGTVVETYQQGYRINGTILRPARVVVAA